MEPITHLAAGLLTGQALGTRLTSRLASRPASRQDSPRGLVALCAVAAVIPDIDALGGYINPEYSLLYHRGLTHSLFGILPMALLLAWLARRFGAKIGLAQGFLAALLALGTHLFLDAATAYGTQLLAPFSTTRYSFEGLFAVDPPFTLSLLLAALLAWRAARNRAVIAVIGLCWMLFYPGTSMLLRQGLEAGYAKKLAASGQGFQSVHLSPDALAPYYWRVIVDTGDEYLTTTIAAPGLMESAPLLRLRKADRGELERLGQQASLFRTFDWFAIWPVEELIQSGAGPAQLRTMRYADLRFMNTNPVVARLLGSGWSSGRVHAQITAILAPDGSLKAYRYENQPAQQVMRLAIPGTP